MKKLYKYIALVIGIVAFISCADDELVGSFGKTGTDVTLKLNVQTQAKKNVTVGRNAEDDEMLYDLHFYVFNSKEELTGHAHFTKDIEAPSGSIAITAKTGTSYIYAVANINGSSYYTIEDGDKELLENPEGKLTLSKLKNIQFARKVSEGNNILSPNPDDGIYMMSGYINDGNPVTIKDDGVFDEEDNELNTIYLYRILAKNTLKIETASYEIDAEDEDGNPIKETVYKGKFTPTSYRLCNVPTGGTLIPNINISETTEYLKKTVEGVVTNNITEAEVESSYYDNSPGSEFTFYYPENLQVVKPNTKDNPVKDKNDWLWKDRENNKWTDDKKTFTYADDKAAYIEIQGKYEYEGEDEKINADVTYTIHLGDFATNIQDFNVIRNSNYTYRVIVNGVEDIIAEATKDDDGNSEYNNPYAEGLVIRTTEGEHYEVDAHYEARVMAFKLSELKELIDDGYGYFLNIETPFEKMDEIVYVKNDGVYSFENAKDPFLCGIHDVESKFSKENLFGWVRFVENGAVRHDGEEGNNLLVSGGASTHVCRYPGDDRKKYSYTTTGETTVKGITYNGGWMNAFELLAELYDKAYEGNTGMVYYTCFIDENYYENKSWMEYVNQLPRKIQIANHLSVSPDEKSLYADVAYSVSQHSIATFYKDDDLKAFGTEIIDEEDLYNCRLGSTKNIDLYENSPIILNVDDWDGFTSTRATNTTCSATSTIEEITQNWFGQQTNTITTEVEITNDDKDTYRKWYKDEYSVVTITENNGRPSENKYDIVTEFKSGIQPLYKSATKACMSRNRDTNGDGNIDEDEVKWYLASVGQYHALYIAQKSLPAESRLISEDDLRTLDKVDYYSGWDESGHDIRGKYHYYTSSAKKFAGTYWPEEGLTNNGVELANGFTQRAELIRCVRTLENGKPNQPGKGLLAPDKYYTFGNIADNTFDLSGIDTWRTGMPKLNNHHELQPLNELSPKFMVASESRYNNEEYSLLNLSGNDDDPCSEYKEGGYNDWRTPNQKEMALILAEIPDQVKKRRHGVRTRFSAYNGDDGTNSWHGPYSWHTRYGFSVETSGKFNVTGDNVNVDIRCVRDVD